MKIKKQQCKCLWHCKGIKKSIGRVHMRERRYYGFGYACNQALGKIKAKEKMTPFHVLVTCRNCRRKKQ